MTRLLYYSLLPWFFLCSKSHLVPSFLCNSALLVEKQNSSSNYQILLITARYAKVQGSNRRVWLWRIKVNHYNINWRIKYSVQPLLCFWWLDDSCLFHSRRPMNFVNELFIMFIVHSVHSARSLCRKLKPIDQKRKACLAMRTSSK